MHPWTSAAIGGVLIGLAATLLLLFNGRIAGISGIVNGLTRRSTAEDWAWRGAFLAGLMVAGAATMAWLGQVSASPVRGVTLAIAGLLVGFGTALGGGCTSGHGVCGLGRLSPRSLVAVVTFIACAMLTVLALRAAGVRP